MLADEMPQNNNCGRILIYTRFIAVIMFHKERHASNCLELYVNFLEFAFVMG